MKTESIKLDAGERIDVVKGMIGYSIFGPAVIVVITEESAVGAADEIVGNQWWNPKLD